jgi:hypothetical protein
MEIHYEIKYQGFILDILYLNLGIHQPYISFNNGWPATHEPYDE